MKILYAIQVGNRSHLAMAKDLIPYLQLKGEVDVLVSGDIGLEVDLDYPIKYAISGLSFFYNKKGKINYWKSLNQLGLHRFVKAIKSFPVESYDLIINNDEPISAWAAMLKRKPYISIGEQVVFQEECFPKITKKNGIKEFVLKNYVPIQHPIGMHFQNNEDKGLPPFIRKATQSLKTNQLGHYTVYLPTIPNDIIIKTLRRIPSVRWELFSECVPRDSSGKNILVRPFTEESLMQSIANSEGCLCEADFQLNAEVLYLKKKLMLVPSQKEYEQRYNAAVLKDLGIPVLNKIGAFSSERILSWVERSQDLNLSFTEDAGVIVRQIFEKHESIKKQDSKTVEPVSLPLRLVKSFFF